MAAHASSVQVSRKQSTPTAGSSGSRCVVLTVACFNSIALIFPTITMMSRVYVVNLLNFCKLILATHEWLTDEITVAAQLLSVNICKGSSNPVEQRNGKNNLFKSTLTPSHSRKSKIWMLKYPFSSACEVASAPRTRTWPWADIEIQSAPSFLHRSSVFHLTLLLM